ncbi:hypothetical protein Rhe02_80050 [Rhizocola hellebori]|uniref:Lipoprotein n=1 Tax=Rhizocola hellebori TaxID=1392758 RepID=A0A8J3QIC6_9ACTN|nr:hypothetical protein [Rhizocola hellebori]GIH09938.1 hypothetical protein Rhe02_80050 [Rhizocola hellebori]
MRAVPLRLVAALCLAAFGVGGCEAINEATAPIERGELLDDMSTQLDRGKSVLYHADYQLAGGYKASVGQQIAPARTVYRYPGGMILVHGSDQTSCNTTSRPAKCDVNSITLAGAGVPSTYAEATKHGLITAPVVVDLLKVAALEPGASVEPHDTTIAGQQASCLEVSGLTDAISPAFSACVTAEGVLASFKGLVGGVNVDQALIEVTKRVAEDAFSLPVGADVADLRPRASAASIG